MRATIVGIFVFITGLIAVPAAAAPRGAVAVAASMHRGVNILGYDPMWQDPAKARFKRGDYAVIRKGGFDFVRVALQAFRHMDAQNRLDPTWLSTLDGVVQGVRAAGLTVILDEHDFDPCSDDPAGCRPKLIAFWEQVGARYADQPDTVVFEMLNEPHAGLNGEAWNALLTDVLATIRKTNPTRAVIIGPSHWNNLSDLPVLKLPENDRNIIVTFHYYEPFRFTHQGAPWSTEKTTSGVTWGSDAERARLAKDFDTVAMWAKAHRRPVLLGEFGAFDKSGTPTDLRAAYTAAVARAAESHGFAWAYWQFDSDFIVYDLDKGQWVRPIKNALIPPVAAKR